MQKRKRSTNLDFREIIFENFLEAIHGLDQGVFTKLNLYY